MAEVTGKTSEEIDELLDDMITSGRTEAGNLILVRKDGSEIFAGYLLGGGGVDPEDPEDPGPGENALTYETAAPNMLFVIHRDAYTGTWPAQRPSDRADLIFDVTGVEPSPNWLLDTDRRSIPMPEGGMEIFEVDLTADVSGEITSGTPQTYENVLPTSLFVIYKDPVTGWPASRPSARADIVFELVGTGALPAWVIDRDRRIIPKP